MTQEFQIAVIGAGPAGLMAALWAARAGASVALLEGAEQVGGKLLSAAEEPCNLLPLHSEPDDFYTSGSRNVLRRLFRTWRLQQLRDFLHWDLNIPLEEDVENGSLHPETHDAAAVRDILLNAAVDAGVTLFCPSQIDSACKEGDRFRLSGSCDDLFAEQVILATGGQGSSQTGRDAPGYRIAKSFDHKILTTYPVQVPLHCSDRRFTDLAGLSLPVAWRAVVGGQTVGQGKGEIQFTEQGFDGSAARDASHYVVRDKAQILISWGGHTREEWIPYLKARTRQGLVKAISPEVPVGLLELLLNGGGLRGEMRTALLDRGTTETLLTLLCDFPLPVSGVGGFQVSRATGGGVPLEQMNPSTMESRCCPGLYFCGEILDVFGPSGGFCFQWAFTTGRLAGEAAAKKTLFGGNS